MLYVRSFQAALSEESRAQFRSLKQSLGESLRPILRPTLEAPAALLRVPPDELRRPETSILETFDRGTVAVDGEIFSDGQALVIVALLRSDAHRRLYRTASGMRLAVDESAPQPNRVTLSVIGPTWESGLLTSTKAATERALGVLLTATTYRSERFEELKAEGREPPSPPSVDELAASEQLRDRAARTVAIAIKASGGLLLRDVAKQLPSEDRDRTEALIEGLKTARLVDSEIVIVCAKTQAQVTRAPSQEVVRELSAKGVKCACGRPIGQERIEEALTITDLGRSVLDKARWLTLQLVMELEAVGVPRENILVEQNVGGDEIDCITDISGQLALFELKDKEFNLGNAYSFGAKIGIIRPQHPVILTTEHVGNDAKEHFVRARLAASGREGPYVEFGLGDERNEILYIEGVDTVRSGIEQLASRIYRKDGAAALNRVLPLAAIDGSSVLRAMESAMGQTSCADGGVA